jgi:hypothetical protein
MQLKNFKVLRIALFLALLPLQQCGIYSFSGTNIDPAIETISIANFYNESALGPPDISQRFTEALKQFFQNNTKLRLVNANGDLQLDGSIVGYEVLPAAPTANNQAALNRLTIKVKVNFINTFNEKENFEMVFQSPPGDFPQTQSLQSAEGTLIPALFDQIVLDVFNKTVTNW